MKNLLLIISLFMLSCSSKDQRTVTYNRQAAGLLDFDAMDADVKLLTIRVGAVDDENKNEMTKMRLLNAQKITAQLFEAIEKNNLIVAGKSEEQLNNEIYNLAIEKFGIEKHWHKKIVRSGVNTVSTYGENPSNRTIQEDDILFIDFGPIVEGWESDFARTYVIGHDANKVKLRNDVEKAWYETQVWYQKQTKLKASDLFQYVEEKAKSYGWTFGGEIAGHIVGEYPHEQPLDPKSFELDVHPANHNDMFLPDSKGNPRHWILEIHFIDKKNKIGAYMEQLL